MRCGCHAEDQWGIRNWKPRRSSHRGYRNDPHGPEIELDPDGAADGRTSTGRASPTQFEPNQAACGHVAHRPRATLDLPGPARLLPSRGESGWIEAGVARSASRQSIRLRPRSAGCFRLETPSALRHHGPLRRPGPERFTLSDGRLTRHRSVHSCRFGRSRSQWEVADWRRRRATPEPWQRHSGRQDAGAEKPPCARLWSIPASSTRFETDTVNIFELPERHKTFACQGVTGSSDASRSNGGVRVGQVKT